MYDIPNLRLVNHRLPAPSYLQGRLAALAARSVVCVRVGAGDRPAGASAAASTPTNSAGATSPTSAGSACWTRSRRPRSWTPRARRRTKSSARSWQRPRHRARHASRVVRRRGRRDRSEQGNRPGRGEASLRRDRRRPGRESGDRREPDQRAAGADRQPHAARRKSRSTQTASPASTGRAIPILRFEECPEVTPIVVQRLDERSDRRGRRSDGRGRGGDRQRVLRRHGRADGRVSVDAARVLAAIAGA